MRAGHQCGSTYMVMRLSDISPKTGKKYIFFRLFLSLCQTAWATPIPFASINPTNPRTNPWNFHEKILRIGGAGKWGFFESAILNFLKKNYASYLNENNQPVHMRYHLFLHYGWFLQNLGKDFIRTNMHTTVHGFKKVHSTSVDDLA